MNITIDAAVLEQALFALEQINSPYWSDFVTPHIAQLREALAQPKQEPVAKVQVKMTGGNAGIATMIYEIYDPRREPLKPGDMLYASPQAQAAQPLTVAGGAVFQDAEGKRPVTAIGQPVGRWEPTPLYPPGGAGLFFEKPQAQPLSDEFLREMHHEDQFGLFCDYDDFEQIARAIEQAHGITKGTT